jgi:hypothetical protein
MKTTLDLDDDLLARAKALAAMERKSLTRLIEEGLSLRLRKTAADQGGAQSVIPVFGGGGGGGLLAGIDPCSNRSLLDACDDDA